MLGAVPPDAAAEDVLLDELDDELPQPAAMSAATASEGTMARLRTVIKVSPLRREGACAPPIAVCLARPGRRQVTVSHGRGRVHPD